LQLLDRAEGDGSSTTVPGFRRRSRWHCRAPAPMDPPVLPRGWIPSGRSSSWHPPPWLQTNKVASTSKDPSPAGTRLARDGGAASRSSSKPRVHRMESPPSQSPRLAFPPGAPEVPPPTATEHQLLKGRRGRRSICLDSPRQIHLTSSLAAASTVQAESQDAGRSPSIEAQKSRMQLNCNRVARRLHGIGCSSANRNFSGFPMPNTEVDRAIEDGGIPVRRTSVHDAVGTCSGLELAQLVTFHQHRCRSASSAGGPQMPCNLQHGRRTMEEAYFGNASRPASAQCITFCISLAKRHMVRRLPPNSFPPFHRCSHNCDERERIAYRCDFPACV